MHIIGCLDRPTDGEYQFKGQAVQYLSDRELAKLRNGQIGFVFQTFNLINRASAVRNVALPLFYAGRTKTNQAALRALEAVGLANRADHRPTEMSGGERQRVAIARAIVNDPALLLADEPTGNLDSKTGQQIIDSFLRLNERGVTIVLVTHEPDIAAQAHRVIQMRDGKIVDDRKTDGAAPTTPSETTERTSRPHGAEEHAGPQLHPKARSAWRAALTGLVSLILLVALPKVMAVMPDALNSGKLRTILTLVLVAAFVGGTVLAIPWGVKARRLIRQNPGRFRGKPRAIAATAVGCINVALLVLSIAALILGALR
jgi:putative ABC transport system ATP-binding protein